MLSKKLSVERATERLWAFHYVGSLLVTYHFLIPTTPGRDPDWIDLNIQYTIDVVGAGVIAGLFPEFLRP